MEAFKYTLREQHPALLMEMRLGKTLVAIRRINLYQPRHSRDGLRVLVVAPNPALDSWEIELNKEGESDIVYLHGTKAQRKKILKQKCKWTLFNKEGHRALPEISEIDWDAVVLDESTFVKNAKTKVTKYFIKHFRECPHRWIMTGRVNPESDLEVHQQLTFLRGSAFGFRNFWKFRAKCFTNADQYNWFPKPGIQGLIRRHIAETCFVQRREDVGMDVPKVYEHRMLELPSTLQRAYKQCEDLFILEWDQQEIDRTAYKPVQQHYLRKICGGFIGDEFVWDGKAKELHYLLTSELKSEPVVVFCDYVQEVKMLRDFLTKKKIKCDALWGDVKPADRRKIKRKFQEGRIQVVVCQPEVVKMGTDFSRADTVIFYSTPMSGETRIQAEDRILEVMKAGPLLVIDMMCKDTIEVDCFDLIRAKDTAATWTLKRVRKLMEQRRVGMN